MSTDMKCEASSSFTNEDDIKVPECVKNAVAMRLVSMPKRRYETLLNATHTHSIVNSHIYTSHAYPCTYKYTYTYA